MRVFWAAAAVALLVFSTVSIVSIVGGSGGGVSTGSLSQELIVENGQIDLATDASNAAPDARLLNDVNAVLDSLKPFDRARRTKELDAAIVALGPASCAPCLDALEKARP